MFYGSWSSSCAMAIRKDKSLCSSSYLSIREYPKCNCHIPKPVCSKGTGVVIAKVLKGASQARLEAHLRARLGKNALRRKK